MVGTWTATGAIVNPTNPSAGGVTQQAVLQLEPNGTFVEGYLQQGNPAVAYAGLWSYNQTTQKMAYIITAFTPSNGTAPVPFNTTALTSTVFFGNNTPGDPTQFSMNNQLLFSFKDHGVSPSEFTLPPLPTPGSRTMPPTTRPAPVMFPPESVTSPAIPDMTRS
jgi:hypothetical protein